MKRIILYVILHILMTLGVYFLATENINVQENVGVQSVDAASREYVYENRRYVGMKETVWYVVYDMLTWTCKRL